MQPQTLRDSVSRFLLSNKGFFIACTLILLISSIFLLQTLGRAYRENGYDFTSYLLSSEALFAGTNPYHTGSPFPFIYPLFLCVILSPLTLLPYWSSNVLWFFLNGGALYFSIRVLLKQYVDSLSYNELTALFLVPFLILTNVIQNNLLNGQINFIVLLFCVLFLKYYVESRKSLASFYLSAAIAIKLTPLILIAYLIARREFLWVVLTFAFSVFLILGLPYIIAGQKTFDWYSQYAQSFLVHNIASRSEASDGFAFSITSLANFLLPSMPKLISFIIAGLVSVVPIVWIQVNSRKDAARQQALLLTLYMLAILLISPVSETHHLINLFPAVSIATLATLSHFKKQSQVGVLTLGIVLVSVITAKFYHAASIISIIALYVSILWIFLRHGERTTAYNTPNNDAHFGEGK